MVPVLGRTAEPVQFDHRQREIEAEALGLLHHLPVQIETRLVLRRGGRDQPPVVADRNEDTQFHGSCLALALHSSGAPPCVVAKLTARRVPSAAPTVWRGARPWMRPFLLQGQATARGLVSRPQMPTAAASRSHPAERSSDAPYPRRNQSACLSSLMLVTAVAA